MRFVQKTLPGTTAVYAMNCVIEQRVLRKRVWPPKEKTLVLVSALLLTTSVILRQSLNPFDPYEP